MEYRFHGAFYFARMTGLEPATGGFGDRCSPN